MSKYGRQIKKELDSRVPNLKDQIKARIDFAGLAQASPARKKSGFSLRRFAYSVCIIFVLAAIVVSATLLTPPPGGTTVVVSINPRVEFLLEDDLIASQKGLNEDGVTLLLNDDYVGMNVDQAVNLLLGRAKSLGFLKDNKTVKLAVNYSNGKRAEKEYKALSGLISEFLNTNLSGASLTQLSEDELEDIIDSYDEKALDGFKESQLVEFGNKLREVINEKITVAKTLEREVREIFNGIEGGRLSVETINTLNGKVNAFLEKYPSELSPLKSKADAKDLEELIEDVEDIVEELEEALEDIEEGRKDDLKERLEDLFEIAWELLNPDRDDD